MKHGFGNYLRVEPNTFKIYIRYWLIYELGTYLLMLKSDHTMSKNLDIEWEN